MKKLSLGLLCLLIDNSYGLPERTKTIVSSDFFSFQLLTAVRGASTGCVEPLGRKEEEARLAYRHLKFRPVVVHHDTIIDQGVHRQGADRLLERMRAATQEQTAIRKRKATQKREKEEEKARCEALGHNLTQDLGSSDLSSVTTSRKEYVPNVDSYSLKLLCAVTGVRAEKGLATLLDHSSQEQEAAGIYRRDSVLRCFDEMSINARTARYYLSEEQRVRMRSVIPGITGAIGDGSYADFMKQVARFKSVSERSSIFQTYGDYYRRMVVDRQLKLTKDRLTLLKVAGELVRQSELQLLEKRSKGLKKIERALELQNIILGLTVAIDQASWSKFEEQLRRFELTPAEKKAGKKNPKEEQVAVFKTCGGFFQERLVDVSLKLDEEDSNGESLRKDLPRIWRCLDGESVMLLPDSVPKIDLTKITGA